MLAKKCVPMAAPFLTKSSFSHARSETCHTIDIYHASLVILSCFVPTSDVPFNRPFRRCWQQSLVSAKIQTL
jgi:hypothetical protein